MSAVQNQPATTAGVVLTSWMAGPVDPGDADVTVSVTEYSAHHRRTLPGAAVTALRMRLGWYAMPGAVGMWLWMLPRTGTGGSISVWAAEEDLQRFINLPHHVDIMDRYGDRGTVRSTTWTADRFDRAAIVDRARRWIVAS